MPGGCPCADCRAGAFPYRRIYNAGVTPPRDHLTLYDCMRLLGLGEATTITEVKRNYRRLALECHPDRHGGSESARRRFSEIASAYRVLMRSLRAVESGRKIGHCWECREFGEVQTGLDGHARCPSCILHGPRRLLPLPVIVIARCLGTILLLGLAVILLWMCLQNGNPAYAAAAALAGAGSLGLLAYTCLTVVHCVDRSMYRRRGRS